MTYAIERVVVGDFFIAPGIGDGKVWIGRAQEPHAGEGGDFPVEALEAIIREFYEANF